MSAASDNRLVVGGPPRANLLPPEIKADERARAQRRGLVALLVLVVVLVGAGYLYSAYRAVTSQELLAEESARTGSLIAEQGEYVEVRRLATQLEVAEAARVVGTSTEIEWQSYLGELQAVLPAGVVVSTVNITSGSPTAAFSQPSGPLEYPRVAELAFSATSATLPDIADWLDGLRTLTGFADAFPGTISFDGGAYTLGMTVHIDHDALANRFAAADEGGEAQE